MSAQYPAPAGQALGRAELEHEAFSSWWTLKVPSAFTLRLTLVGGTAQMLIDGKPVQQCQAVRDTYRACITSVAMATGRHHVEVMIEGDGDLWSGARLAVSSSKDGAPIRDEVEITPY
jgi:hypothetical protein